MTGTIGHTGRRCLRRIECTLNTPGSVLKGLSDIASGAIETIIMLRADTNNSHNIKSIVLSAHQFYHLELSPFGRSSALSGLLTLGWAELSVHATQRKLHL